MDALVQEVRPLIDDEPDNVLPELHDDEEDSRQPETLRDLLPAKSQEYKKVKKTLIDLQKNKASGLKAAFIKNLMDILRSHHSQLFFDIQKALVRYNPTTQFAIEFRQQIQDGVAQAPPTLAEYTRELYWRDGPEHELPPPIIQSTFIRVTSEDIDAATKKFKTGKAVGVDTLRDFSIAAALKDESLKEKIR